MTSDYWEKNIRLVSTTTLLSLKRVLKQDSDLYKAVIAEIKRRGYDD